MPRATPSSPAFLSFRVPAAPLPTRLFSPARLARPHAAVACGSGPAPTRRSAEVTPLSPDRYRVQVTIGGDTLEKLRLAKDLLRHAVPSGDEAVILDRALTALLADLAQRKFAASEKPRRPAARARIAPHPGRGQAHGVAARPRAAVRSWGRTVADVRSADSWSSTTSKPYALGGEATVANIQLRCRSHNAYEARLYFGGGNRNGGAGSVRETTRSYGLLPYERGASAGRPQLVPERVAGPWSAGQRWPAAAVRTHTGRRRPDFPLALSWHRALDRRSKGSDGAGTA